MKDSRKIEGPLHVAFDVKTPQEALALAERLPFDSDMITAKFGFETFYMGYVSMMAPANEDVALANMRAMRKTHEIIGPRFAADLKLCDIPRTNEAAINQIRLLHPRWINFSPNSGPSGLKAGYAALKGIRGYLVPVLTTVTDADSNEMYHANPWTIVKRLGTIGKNAGLHIITSAPDAKKLRKIPEFDETSIVSPGVTLKEGGATRDHARSMPVRIAARYVDGVVMGREFTGADNPLVVAEEVIGILEDTH